MSQKKGTLILKTRFTPSSKENVITQFLGQAKYDFAKVNYLASVEKAKFHFKIQR